MAQSYDVAALQGQMSAYHVEAKREATIGGALRQEGEKFPAVELSVRQFYILLNSGMEGDAYRLVEGPLPVEDQPLEGPEQVLFFTEEGEALTFEDLRLQASEGEAESEERGEPMEASVVDRVSAERAAMAQPADQGRSSGQPRDAVQVRDDARRQDRVARQGAVLEEKGLSEVMTQEGPTGDPSRLDTHASRKTGEAMAKQTAAEAAQRIQNERERTKAAREAKQQQVEQRKESVKEQVKEQVKAEERAE